MNELDINEIWDDFVAKLQYSEPHFYTVIGQCKRCFIDPKIFLNNMFLLSGHKNFYPETGLLEPTENLKQLSFFLPPVYPLTFAAAFPDVIVWYMNSYDDEAFSTNPYFMDIRNNPSKHFDEETGQPTYRFLIMIVIAYGKENSFECRIKPTPQEIQSALDAIYNTDPPYNRDIS